MTEACVEEPAQNGQASETPAPEADVPMEDISAEDEEKVTKLEELFDTDSGDDDVSSPTVRTPASSAPEASLGPTMEIIPDSASDPEILRSFYQRLFPWRYVFQWLNHSPSPTNDFRHREFAFTLQNDAYQRYQSFPTADLFRRGVVNVIPSRFEIGPVYSTNPRERKSFRNLTTFKPLSKELCFDIDLTDYDDVRTCCDGANICEKCWAFITMAIKVLDVALRKDFGFKHILWVYSGRRGAHAWVCDRAARNLSDRERKAIAGYLHLMRGGGTQKGKRVNVSRPLHPHVTRSLEILKPYFAKEVLEDQDPWRTSEQAQKLLDLLPDKALTDALRAKWESSTDRPSTLKWSDIDAVARSGASKRLDTWVLLAAKQDIVLEYSYPRLDIHVSEKLNHLLKSPLIMHPGTGRVCVPINPKRLEEFNPLSVPTVQELMKEIDEWKGEEGGGTQDSGKGVPDWEKTSLKPYIDHFRSFVARLLRDEMGEKVKREREDDKMEF